MNYGSVMDLAVEALMVMGLIAITVLAAALLTGLLIGILQAATSIQEMTLSFIPKLAAMGIALAIFGEWQLALLVDYFETIFERIRTMTF